MEPPEAQNLSLLCKFAKKRHETNCDEIVSYDFIHLHGAHSSIKPVQNIWYIVQQPADAPTRPEKRHKEH